MCKNAFSVEKGVFVIPDIIPYFAPPTRQTKTTNKEMENIPVTAYSGFSNVRGEITLRKVIENITKGVHAKLVFKIRLLVSQGKTEEANNVKKQLPFYTVTAGYSEKR